MKNIIFSLIFFIAFKSAGIAFAELSSEDKDELNKAASEYEMYMYLNKYDKALESCSIIYKYNKALGELNYALIYKMKGDFKKAIEWAKLAAESTKKQNASSEGALLIMANSFALMGEEKDGNKILDQIIKEYPKSPIAYQFYAQYYEKIGDKKNAIKYWQEALKRYTDNGDIQKAKERIDALKNKSSQSPNASTLS